MPMKVLEKLRQVRPLPLRHLLYDSCAVSLPVANQPPPEVVGAIMAATRCVPVPLYWRPDAGFTELQAVQTIYKDRVRNYLQAGGSVGSATLAVTWAPYHLQPALEERWVLPLALVREMSQRYRFARVAFLIDTESRKPQSMADVRAVDVACRTFLPACEVFHYDLLSRVDPEEDGSYQHSPYYVPLYSGVDEKGPAVMALYYGADLARMQAAIELTRKDAPDAEAWLTLTASGRGDKRGWHAGQVDWSLKDQWQLGVWLGIHGISHVDGLIEWKYSQDENPLRWADYLATRLCGLSQVYTPGLFEPAVGWM